MKSRTITWEEPGEAATEGLAMTGLEYLRAMADGRLPGPPIGATMGMMPGGFETGRAVFFADPGEYHYNPIGTVHGGLAATLLDSAMSCAVHTTLAAGDRYTTLELKVNFVRPIAVETGRVRAEGRLLHRGGLIATAEGSIVAERDGQLLAHGTTTCLLMRARPA